MATTPTAARVRSFRGKVWRHYRAHARPMPWRETREPYRILVSEVMLQQTQVDRVRGKYAEFLAAFPGFEALDRAPLARVLAVWQGLGYNRRAVSLKRIARLVAGEHGGRLPDDPAVLATFPGIGPATAASICAFAFDAPVVFVETNIRRVFIHEFFPGAERVPDTELLPLVGRALERAAPRDWYYALMDYGSALARSVPNPNRRSRGYARQSRFEGSDRQLRGALLRALLAGGPSTPARLCAAAGGDDPARARRLLADLEREGLVARAGRLVAVAGGEGGA